MDKLTWKGIIHCHSQVSKDAWMSPQAILNKALKLGLNFVILTDHDTIVGSVALRQLVEKQNLPLEVPLAAEYLTEFGDVIAAFIQEEIKFTNIQDLYDQVKAQGGILILPHPYVGHRHLEKLLPYVQFIEVFNGRTPKKLNKKAEGLCITHGLKPIYGSDAHLLKNLGDAVIEFPHTQTLKEDLLNQPINPLTLSLATKGDYLKSRWIYALKRKKKEIPLMTLRSLWNIAKGTWFREVR